MEKHNFIKVLILCLVLHQTCFSQNGYLISGHITGIEKPDSYAYLTLYDKVESKVRDSAKVEQGKFIFKGKVDEPNLYMISIKDLRGALMLVVENKQITLKGQADQIWNTVITGSALTDEYIQYQTKYSNPVREELIANTVKKEQLLAKGDTASAKELQQLSNNILQKQYVIAEQYIQQHPASFQSLFLLEWGWEEFGMHKARAYLAAMPRMWQQHSLGRKIKSAIEAKEKALVVTKIGKMAPEFTQPDTAHVPVSLASLKGKYVLVDFWASWCGPCRQENPELVRVYQKYKAYGFEILSISLDEDKQRWLDAIGKDHLNWTHVSDLKGWQNQAALQYGVIAIPANFLLDPQGKIIAKELRGRELDTQLREVFF